MQSYDYQYELSKARYELDAINAEIEKIDRAKRRLEKDKQSKEMLVSLLSEKIAIAEAKNGND